MLCAEIYLDPPNHFSVVTLHLQKKYIDSKCQIISLYMYNFKDLLSNLSIKHHVVLLNEEKNEFPSLWLTIP